MSDFDTLYDQALDLYFAGQYELAEKKLISLLGIQSLENDERANVIRRIADCRSNLDLKSEVISLYDEALTYADSTYIKCWIFASKATALAKLHRYPESLTNYQEAIERCDNPDDLHHLESSVSDMLESYEHHLKFGDFEQWKTSLLNKLNKKNLEMDKEDFWKLVEGKPILKD